MVYEWGFVDKDNGIVGFNQACGDERSRVMVR